jgi:CheY-like chemotaxis protein
MSSESNGIEVTKAVDGLEALDKLKNSFFDLTLPDIQFPGMERLEVLKYIVENPVSWQMGIVALTAQALGSDKQLFIGGDCIDYTSISVDLFKLMDVQNTFLSNGKA